MAGPDYLTVDSSRLVTGLNLNLHSLKSLRTGLNSPHLGCDEVGTILIHFIAILYIFELKLF